MFQVLRKLVIFIVGNEKVYDLEPIKGMKLR